MAKEKLKEEIITIRDELYNIQQELGIKTEIFNLQVINDGNNTVSDIIPYQDSHRINEIAQTKNDSINSPSFPLSQQYEACRSADTPKMQLGEEPDLIENDQVDDLSDFKNQVRFSEDVH